jgi:hypothetical protein
MKLKQWGYMTRNEKKAFSFTERAKQNYKRFIEKYERTCSMPFKWS